MSSMLFLALIIVVVSGFIAYFGDWVGRKMGRKRLTLLGLRPRYTAIVISVGAGMLIATLTLILTFAANAHVREAFFTPLGRLKAELRDTRDVVTTTRTELNKAREESAEAEGQLHDVRQRLSDTTGQLNASNQRLAQVQSRYTVAARSLATVQADLDANKRQLAQVTGSLQAKEQQYTAVTAKLMDVERRLRDSEKTLRENAVQLGKLKDEKAALEQERDTLAAEKAALVRQRDELTNLRDTLKQQVDVLSQFVRVNFARLAFNAGQEILTGVIPNLGTVEDRTHMLEGFLTCAEGIVRHQCPKLAKDDAPIVYIDATDGSYTAITREAAIAMLARRARQTTHWDDVIIRLTPANNVPEEGQALVLVNAVEMMPNYLAYIRTNEVAAVNLTVDQYTTRGQVLGILVDELLRKELPQALREREMVPVSRRFDPAHPEIIPDPSISSVSWSELMTATEQVCALRGQVRVIVEARASIRRFGPLDVQLAVRPVR